MPYVFVDDDTFDADTMEAADVVTRADVEVIEQERDALRTERDDAVGRIESLNQELQDTKDRYAKHVISAAQIVDRHKNDVINNGHAQSFSELFADRTEG